MIDVTYFKNRFKNVLHELRRRPFVFHCHTESELIVWQVWSELAACQKCDSSLLRPNPSAGTASAVAPTHLEVAGST